MQDEIIKKIVLLASEHTDQSVRFNCYQLASQNKTPQEHVKLIQEIICSKLIHEIGKSASDKESKLIDFLKEYSHCMSQSASWSSVLPLHAILSLMNTQMYHKVLEQQRVLVSLCTQWMDIAKIDSNTLQGQIEKHQLIDFEKIASISKSNGVNLSLLELLLDPKTVGVPPREKTIPTPMPSYSADVLHGALLFTLQVAKRLYREQKHIERFSEPERNGVQKSDLAKRVPIKELTPWVEHWLEQKSDQSALIKSIDEKVLALLLSCFFYQKESADIKIMSKKSEKALEAVFKKLNPAQKQICLDFCFDHNLYFLYKPIAMDPFFKAISFFEKRVGALYNIEEPNNAWLHNSSPILNGSAGKNANAGEWTAKGSLLLDKKPIHVALPAVLESQLEKEVGELLVDCIDNCYSASDRFYNEARVRNVFSKIKEKKLVPHAFVAQLEPMFSHWSANPGYLQGISMEEKKALKQKIELICMVSNTSAPEETVRLLRL